jgi:hypothetical protein
MTVTELLYYSVLKNLKFGPLRRAYLDALLCSPIMQEMMRPVLCFLPL